jgi:hypothetical protein
VVPRTAPSRRWWERSDSGARTFKEIPYETACELFEELIGLPLSAHTAHEVTQAVSKGLTILEVAPSREEILAKIVAVAAHSGAGD